MILGIGTDITDYNRFHLNGIPKERLAKKILTEFEYSNYNLLPVNLKILYLAKIWSIKESISKAYGTGICKELYWKNIEVSKDKKGKPMAKIFNRSDIKIHVSTSDDKEKVVSMVLLEIV